MYSRNRKHPCIFWGHFGAKDWIVALESAWKVMRFGGHLHVNFWKQRNRASPLKSLFYLQVSRGSESGWVRTAWQRESANIMRIDAVETRVDVSMDCKPKWTRLSRNWDLVMHISICDLKEEREKRHSTQHKGHNSWPLLWGKPISCFIISLPHTRHKAFPANIFIYDCLWSFLKLTADTQLILT